MSRPHRRRPPFVHRRARIGFGCAAWLVVLGVLVAAVALCSPVHAAPTNDEQQAFEYWAHHGSSVCATLDRDPTINGIATAGLDIINKGHLTSRQAGLVVNYAVHYTCPQHQRLIDMYIAAQRPHPRMTVAAGGDR